MILMKILSLKLLSFDISDSTYLYVEYELQ